MDRTGFRHSPARIATYSKAAERAEAHLAQNIQTKEGDSQRCQREGMDPRRAEREENNGRESTSDRDLARVVKPFANA